MTITARKVGHDTRQPSDLLAAFLTVINQAPHWPDRACRSHDPSLWDDRLDLHDNNWNTVREPEADRTARHTEAVRICHTCPRRAECLARRAADPTLGLGIWGGELFGADHTTGRCAHCNNLFARPDANTKYCGPGCTQAAHRLQQRAWEAAARPARIRPPGLTHCANCGEPISSGRRSNRARSCSDKCKKALERRNARARDRATRHTAPLLPCVVCDEPVPHERRDRGGKTCSPECQDVHRRAVKTACMAAARGKPTRPTPLRISAAGSTPQGKEAAA